MDTPTTIEVSPHVRARNSNIDHLSSANSHEDERSTNKRGKIQLVWGSVLGRQFTAISTFFIHNYTRLGMSATEFAFVCQLMTFKWDERAPYPSLATIAARMGNDQRYLRKVCAKLQKRGLLHRELSKSGGPSKYHLNGLFTKLETLMKQDAAATAAKEAAIVVEELARVG